MHSVTAYEISVYDSAKKGVPNHEKYLRLNEIRRTDLLDFFDVFFNKYVGRVHKIEERNVSFSFDNVQINKAKEERTISLWMRHGRYGQESEIVDVDTGDHRYDKKENEADLISHFVYIKLPKGDKAGILVCHSIGVSGIKTDLSSLLHDDFKSKYGDKLSIKFKPLAYKKALKLWQEKGVAKSIRVVGYKKLTDLTEVVRYGGIGSHEWTMRPPKGGDFGKLGNFFNSDSEERELVSVVEKDAVAVKTTVEMDGRTRVFSIMSGNESDVVVVEIPEDEIEFENGNPKYDSMNTWVKEYVDDILVDKSPSKGGLK